MDEPTVNLPVRLVLRMARYINHYAELLEAVTEQKCAEAARGMVKESVRHIAEQCPMDEVKAASVAMELEERV